MTAARPTARLTLDPAFRIAPVDRRLFGTFVEHMGRCVYSGIFEPDHPTADDDGFRQDVLRLVRELGATAVRYPGGNFVSGYRWRDGVGPVDQRPRRLDLAWRTIEPNTFGVNEFARWCRKAGLDPIMAVNLGTAGIREAIDLVEYCNFPGGTAMSDLRRSHGQPQPHGIKTWCLGNELDGPWQVGHKTAWEYGRLAAETARAMRMVDPDLELVACGSSHSDMPTFGAWEATVLEHCHDLVDYISLHNYFDPLSSDVETFLASSVTLQRGIESVIATADHVAAKLKSKRRLKLSVDEWNVWYQSRPREPHPPDKPGPRALIEDVYNVADAVVVGSLLITLLRHADRVGIACQAQLVNVIAPILTEPGGRTWRQTIFHPFAQASRWARGEVLRVEPAVDSYDTQRHGDVPLVDATATYDESTGQVTLLAVNRSTSKAIGLEAVARALPDHRVIEATTLGGGDIDAHNTADAPDAVAPRPSDRVALDDGLLRAELPPVSWNVIRLAPAARGAR